MGLDASNLYTILGRYSNITQPREDVVQGGRLFLKDSFTLSRELAAVFTTSCLKGGYRKSS